MGGPSESGEHPARGWRPHPALVSALAVYVLVRALVLYSAFDQVALPQFELFMMGAIARDVVGPSSEVPLLFYYDNAMGPVLAAYFAVPFFKLFGPSYLALKLVSFVVLMPGLPLIWSFLRRHYGVRAAAIGAFLFALPPTTVFKYTLLPVGNHAENVTLTMLAICAFFRMYSGERRTAALLLAGAAGGLALTFFLGALIPVALLLAVHLGLVGWQRSLREIPVALAGLLVGLVPLLLANTLLPGASGLDFLAAKFGSSGSGTGFDASVFAGRVRDFFFVYLPDAGTFPDFLGISGDVAEGAFLACTVVAWLLLLPDTVRSAVALLRGALGGGALEGTLSTDDRRALVGRAALVPLYLYLPLTAIAFGLSDLRIADHAWPMEAAGYRYYLPHFLIAILLIAIAAARLLTSARAAGLVLAGAALACGLFTLDLVDPTFSRPNLGAHYAGYNIKQNARVLLLPRNGPLEPPQITRYTESFPPPFRERIWGGLGLNTTLRTLFEGGAIESLDLGALLAPYPSERRGDMARGVGTLFRHRQSGPGELRPEEWALMERYLAEGVEHAARVPEGLCSRWSPLLEFRSEGHVEENLKLVHTAQAQRSRALATAVARGFGIDSGRLLTRDIRSEVDRITGALERIPSPLVPAFFDGLGLGLADGGERPVIPASVDGWVPEGHVERVLASFLDRLVEMHGRDEGLRVMADVDLPESWLD